MRKLLRKIWSFFTKNPRKKRPEIFFEEIFFIESLPEYLQVQKPELLNILVERWRSNRLLEEVICKMNNFEKEILKVASRKIILKDLFFEEKEITEEREKVKERLLNIFSKKDLAVLDKPDVKTSLFLSLVLYSFGFFSSFFLYQFFIRENLVYFFSSFFCFSAFFILIYFSYLEAILKKRRKGIRILLAKSTMLDRMLKEYLLKKEF
jgi:hypothetical protein